MMAPALARIRSFPIVGYGAVNALGTSRATVFEGVARGLSGLRGLASFPTSYGVMSESLPELPLRSSRFDTRLSRISWLAVAPLADAVARSVRTYGAARVAILVGSSNGGILETEEAYAMYARGEGLPKEYSLEQRHSFDAITDFLAEATGAAGPRYVVSVACASSAKALGAAQRLIAAGAADAALVVGADTACQMTLRGFAALRILSAAPCRPFDQRRDGVSLGEGAACLLLERDGRSPLHLLSVGESSDAHHMTAPHPEGRGAISAMRSALRMAGLSPSEIGYVNAHGTGTPLNDQVEGDALLEVIGSNVPVSSSKGMVGHLLGAAGATEAVLTLDALARSVLPPNVGCTERDPKVKIELLEHPREAQVRHALSNSFGFGGSNATVALGASRGEPGASDSREAIHVVGIGFWAPGVPDAQALLSSVTDSRVTQPKSLLLGARARGRASLLTRMLVEVVEQAFALDRSALASAPLVFGSAYGEMATTLELLASLAEAGALLSPLRFYASVHSNAAGILSVETGNRAFSTALAAGARTASAALLEAAAWLWVHGGEIGVAIADEASPRALTKERSYAPMAMAFRLVRAATAPPGALGCFRLPAPVSVAVTDVADRSDNPSAGALPLLRALALGRFGRTSIGPGWSVDLRPAERPA